MGSSLRFLGHPCGACPGLGTPASRPDLANNGRCQILPSARLTTSASPRQTISGLNPHGLLPPCLRFAPTSRPLNGKTRYCLSARLWSGVIHTRWMTIRGFANSSSVPPLPSFSERDNLDSRAQNGLPVPPLPVRPEGGRDRHDSGRHRTSAPPVADTRREGYPAWRAVRCPSKLCVQLAERSLPGWIARHPSTGAWMTDGLGGCDSRPPSIRCAAATLG